jgi:pyrroloquinoline-quinone synthase
MGVWKTFTELHVEIERFDLLRHPFYEAWSAGKLAPEDLREYAAAYYHQVAAFPTYLSALHSHLPDGYLRRAVVKNLSEEEIEGQPHSEMWLDFAEGFGADREAVRSSQPISQVRDLIETFRRQMRSPASGLAALYAYESKVPAIAKEKARTLREAYAADDRTCLYFDVHITADAKHSHVWKEQLERLLAAEPNLASEAIDGGRLAAEALWKALDGIEETSQARLSASTVVGSGLSDK